MHEKKEAMNYIAYLNRALDDWNIVIQFPNDYVRILCYQMGEEEIDTRMIREPTDRTHLAYAIAYESDYFLTSDKNLIRYRIPTSLQQAGFKKPEDYATCDVQGYRTQITEEMCSLRGLTMPKKSKNIDLPAYPGRPAVLHFKGDGAGREQSPWGTISDRQSPSCLSADER